jgi:DHA2 family methylenomycin A resistance protein-like MFS transporter
MALASVGMFLFSTVTVTSSYGSFWWHMVLIGAGLGLCISPLTAVVINNVSNEQVGMASSSINAAQQTGSVLGIAILGVIVTSRMDAVVRAGINALSLPGAEKAALLGSVSKHSLTVGMLTRSERGAAPLVNRAFVEGLQAGMRTSGVVSPARRPWPSPFCRQAGSAPSESPGRELIATAIGVRGGQHEPFGRELRCGAARLRRA